MIRPTERVCITFAMVVDLPFNECRFQIPVVSQECDAPRIRTGNARLSGQVSKRIAARIGGASHSCDTTELHGWTLRAAVCDSDAQLSWEKATTIPARLENVFSGRSGPKNT